MNDSHYGLTASIWTDASNAASVESFERIVEQLETGTVFLNRCDYLDPALAWTGVKDSGRGVSLSRFGECFWCRDFVSSFLSFLLGPWLFGLS